MARALALLSALHLAAATSLAAPAPWRNTSLPIAARVASLVSLLTLEEKVANLDANGAPGAPRLGLGPYRMDEECMRGAVTSGVSKRPLGTGVPTLLALAGTFNVSLLAAIGEMSAREVRAYYNIDRRTAGLTTTANCYAPVVNLIRDPRFGRAAEMAIGECPTLGRVYARAWTAAMRGGAPASNSTAKLVTSVCKHLGVYAGPEDTDVGRFAFNAVLDERTWRETFLPSFRGSAEAGADAFMCSYSSVTFSDAPSTLSSVPDCASDYLLNTVVRGEWGWEGWITSDANAVSNIYTTHHYAGSDEGAAIAAIKGGCDVELTCCGSTPVFGTLVAAVRAGRLAAGAIDTAISRVLTGRFASGDLDPPASSPWAHLNESDIYAPASLALAREAARQSVVLLANKPSSEGGLPWTRAALSGKTLCVVGPLANATEDFMGGYAPIPAPGDIISPLRAFTTALAGIAHAVALIPGCVPGDGVVCATIQPGLAAALEECDVLVAILGTSAHASHKRGMPNAACEAEGVDRTEVSLAGQQGQVLSTALSANKPLAVVIASGGMVDVGSGVVDVASALLAAPFGGQWAGDAIAAVVMGDENPAARLTTTWYTTHALAKMSSITNYSMTNRTYRFAPPDAARFAFGHGLSFSNFTYTALSISPPSPQACDTLTLSFTLTNVAGPDGIEVAQVYTSFNASVPQPRLNFVNWERVLVDAGASVTLHLTITPEDNAILRDGDFMPIIEPGVRTLWVGGSSVVGGVGLSGEFTVTGPPTPLSTCGGGGGVGEMIPHGVAHVWPRPVLGEGGAARWAAAS